MSTLEAPPLQRRWNFLIRTKTSSDPAGSRPRSTPIWQAAWQKWRSDRPLRMGVVCWLAAWIVLQTTFVACMHYTFQGNSYWAFLPSKALGIPARESAAGFEALSKYGYDGQQYYHISNDLFGRFDTYQHIDNVLYRYQRIGIPMLAGGLASLLGYDLTPPMLYHTVQFGITTAGFGLLVYWLLLKRQPAVFALAWLFSTGTLQSLWMGLLDAPADAFFIAALAAALSRRLWLYAPAAILLVLTREMYVLFAFAIFATTAWGRVAFSDSSGVWHPLRGIDWRDVRGYWPRVVLSALPGIVMLAWATYLGIHFKFSPITARMLNPSAHSYPFYMMYKYIERFIKTDNAFEFRMAVISAFTLITTLVLLLGGLKRLPWALLCTIPYVLMTTMLGAAMWEAHGSHMRVMCTTLVVIGVFLLQFDASLLLRFLLTLHAIVGVGVHYDLRLANQPVRSPAFMCQEPGYYTPNPPDAPDNPVLTDMTSAVTWVDCQDVLERKYHGVFNRVHREVRPVTVAVTNYTSEIWQPGLGKHPLWLGYVLYNEDKTRLLATHSILIDKPIEPGETREFTMNLELLRPRRKYAVEFSVWQDGAGWFIRTDPKFGGQYTFEVK